MADEEEEIQLQATITNKTEWDEMLLTKGVVVIDVYQAWCGPCKAVVNVFKKLKEDFGEDVLHFAVAEIDSIPTLQPLRKTCEPVFLFCVNGKILAIVRGVNVPLLIQKITELVQEEKAIAAGQKERPEVEELVFLEEKSSEDTVDETESDEVVTYTVGIIKPNDVSEGCVEEIKQEIIDAGFGIEAAEEKMLTEEEIRDIYAQNNCQPDFEDFVQFMRSGPCHVLIISKKEETDAIPHWKELHGESEPEKPGRLEGAKAWETTLHTCDVQDSVEYASRQLGFFFPNFDVKETDQEAEKTLALITPCILKERQYSIVQRIMDEGFKIAMRNAITLSEEQVREFYKEHESEKYFPVLLEQMTSGPTLVLALTQESAVAQWRDIILSKLAEEAKEENPDSSTPDEPQSSHGQALALIKPAASKHKDDILHKIQGAGLTISKIKAAALTHEMAKQFYKEHEEEPFFEDLVNCMAEGPSVIMILTKKNAVEEWRQLMGPTAPEVAKKSFPDSIRAKFAQAILSNSVHGSSNKKHARKSIEFVFGEIHID